MEPVKLISFSGEYISNFSSFLLAFAKTSFERVITARLRKKNFNRRKFCSGILKGVLSKFLNECKSAADFGRMAVF